MRQALIAIAGVMVCGLGVQAQDTRVVTEPKIPASCVVLKAELTKVGGLDGIAAADESKRRADWRRVENSAVEFASG